MCGRALLGEEATCILMDPDGPTPCFIIHWRENLEIYMGPKRGDFMHFCR
jgi:hypothetical protein